MCMLPFWTRCWGRVTGARCVIPASMQPGPCDNDDEQPALTTSRRLTCEGMHPYPVGVAAVCELWSGQMAWLRRASAAWVLGLGV